MGRHPSEYPGSPSGILTQNRIEPSFSVTSTMGDSYGLGEGLITSILTQHFLKKLGSLLPLCMWNVSDLLFNRGSISSDDLVFDFSCPTQVIRSTVNRSPYSISTA